MQNDHAQAARYARRALEIVELAEDDYYTARAHEMMAHVEIDRAQPRGGAPPARPGLAAARADGKPGGQGRFPPRARPCAGGAGTQRGGRRDRHGGLRAARRREAACRRAAATCCSATSTPRPASPSGPASSTSSGSRSFRRTPTATSSEAYSKLASLLEGRGEPDAALVGAEAGDGRPRQRRRRLI